MKNKKMKAAARLAAVLAATLVLLASSAACSFAASDFIIRDFDIKMSVNEDDTYLITETLKVEFTSPSHGIYVVIPKKTVLDRDGQKSEFNAEVRDFKVLSGQPCKEEKDENGYKFRIGDEKSYADTETVYSYSYLYDTKGDHLRDADEVYHNLVGTTWEAQSIDHVSFEVVFPKDIDMNNVGIKTGNQTDVPFEVVDARTLKGETEENVLGGLTVRAVLPQGYFTREAKDPTWIFYALTGLLVLAAAAGFVMWRRYGKDPVYPVTLEFNPPEGLSAPEIAYLANGELTNNDVVSILLTLADKGYLKIREFEKETGKKKKKMKTCYEIEKLREYDGNVIGEKAFMKGLFEDGDKVETEDLENKFYKTIDEIKKKIEAKYEGKLYDETAAAKASLMYALGWAGLIALHVVARITGNGFGRFSLSMIISVLLPLFFTGSGFHMIADAMRDKKKPRGYLWPLGSVAIGLFFTWADDTFVAWQTVPFFICLACCLLLFIMGGLCERKTEWYAEIKARIKGFTDFLKTAEKDQMETLAEKDPDYYYRNLAFAFALGVTAVYAKRFAPIADKAPEWYESRHYGTYGTYGFLDSINDMTDSVSSSLTSSPSGSGGGGSFSGGGGGGGSGGGSW